jgi:hypothetical protein
MEEALVEHAEGELLPAAGWQVDMREGARIGPVASVDPDENRVVAARQVDRSDLPRSLRAVEGVPDGGGIGSESGGAFAVDVDLEQRIVKS